MGSASPPVWPARLDRFILAHPWVWALISSVPGSVVALLLFDSFAGAGAVMLAAFLLVGWSASQGPGRQNMERRVLAHDNTAMRATAGPYQRPQPRRRSGWLLKATWTLIGVSVCLVVIGLVSGVDRGPMLRLAISAVALAIVTAISFLTRMQDGEEARD